MSKKHTKLPMNIIYNPVVSEYYILQSFRSNKITSTYLNKESIPNEPLIQMKKRFEKIKFEGLTSLVEFCKNEKLVTLLLVFEWINFFIYKVSSYVLIAGRKKTFPIDRRHLSDNGC
jgi:hypothetical protein